MARAGQPWGGSPPRSPSTEGVPTPPEWWKPGREHNQPASRSPCLAGRQVAVPSTRECLGRHALQACLTHKTQLGGRGHGRHAWHCLSSLLQPALPCHGPSPGVGLGKEHWGKGMPCPPALGSPSPRLSLGFISQSRERHSCPERQAWPPTLPGLSGACLGRQWQRNLPPPSSCPGRLAGRGMHALPAHIAPSHAFYSLVEECRLESVRFQSVCLHI